MGHASSTGEGPRPVTASSRDGRRWLGVPTVTALLLVVVLLAATVWDQFRHQLALSFTRMDPAFSEIYFEGGAGQRLTCRRVAAGEPVEFSIAFNGGSTRTVDHVVTLRASRTESTRMRSGDATGSSGDVVRERVQLPDARRLVAQRYDVRIQLRGSKQGLLVHCPAVRP